MGRQSFLRRWNLPGNEGENWGSPGGPRLRLRASPAGRGFEPRFGNQDPTCSRVQPKKEKKWKQLEGENRQPVRHSETQASLETLRKGAILVWKPRGTSKKRTEESGQGYRGEENSALRNDPRKTTGYSQDAHSALAGSPRRANIRPTGKLWEESPGSGGRPCIQAGVKSRPESSR